jgi:hypothetical protein
MSTPTIKFIVELLQNKMQENSSLVNFKAINGSYVITGPTNNQILNSILTKNYRDLVTKRSKILLQDLQDGDPDFIFNPNSKSISYCKKDYCIQITVTPDIYNLLSKQFNSMMVSNGSNKMVSSTDVTNVNFNDLYKPLTAYNGNYNLLEDTNNSIALGNNVATLQKVGNGTGIARPIYPRLLNNSNSSMGTGFNQTSVNITSPTGNGLNATSINGLDDANNNTQGTSSSNDNQDKSSSNDNQDKSSSNDNQDKSSSNDNQDKSSNNNTQGNSSNNDNQDKSSSSALKNDVTPLKSILKKNKTCKKPITICLQE